MERRKLLQFSVFVISKSHFSSSVKSLAHLDLSSSTTLDENDPLYADVPKPRKDKSERKPYPSPMKDLIRRAKEEKKLRNSQPCRVLDDPPDNGLLVPELVILAFLFSGLSKIIPRIPVHRCRFCSEVHIGKEGHEIRTCTGPGSSSRTATHVWKRGEQAMLCFSQNVFTSITELSNRELSTTRD